MLKKNDEFNLKITGYTSEGGGVGKYDGQAVFVENTAVGDEILCHIIKAKNKHRNVLLCLKTINTSYFSAHTRPSL